MDEKKKHALVTIGIPVFNGEKFIEKRLDSILSQSLKDFEIVISDNASLDNTSAICKEYAEKDNRIKYFRQKENIGPLQNFNFVLLQARSEFFVWAAVDDLWDEKFLSKNMEVLQSKKDVVGSLSKIVIYGPNTGVTTKKGAKQSIKKILFPIGPTGINSITGSYDEKVRYYLKNSSCSVIYSVFRTKELKQGYVTEQFLGNDWAANLNILKFGDIHVIDEKLMQKSNQGISGKDIVFLARSFNKGFLETIFPWVPFSRWCIKNLGVKIFFKNLDYFVMLNYIGLTAQLKKAWLENKNS